MKKCFFVLSLLAMSVFIAQLAIADKTAADAAKSSPSDQNGTIAHKDYAGMKISDCNDCHKSEGVAPNHGPDWVREHRVLAKEGQKNCSACHEQSFCLDCHKGGGIDAKLSTKNYRAITLPRAIAATGWRSTRSRRRIIPRIATAAMSSSIAINVTTASPRARLKSSLT